MLKRLFCLFLGHLDLIKNESLGGHFLKTKRVMYSIVCCERCHVVYLRKRYEPLSKIIPQLEINPLLPQGTMLMGDKIIKNIGT